MQVGKGLRGPFPTAQMARHYQWGLVGPLVDVVPKRAPSILSTSIYKTTSFRMMGQ